MIESWRARRNDGPGIDDLCAVSIDDFDGLGLLERNSNASSGWDSVCFVWREWSWWERHVGMMMVEIGVCMICLMGRIWLEVVSQRAGLYSLWISSYGVPMS